MVLKVYVYNNSAVNQASLIVSLEYAHSNPLGSPDSLRGEAETPQRIPCQTPTHSGGRVHQQSVLLVTSTLVAT